MRLFYTLQSLWKLKKANLKGSDYKDYWQAGKSVEAIDSCESATTLMRDLGEKLKELEASKKTPSIDA
jgi:nitronate monooxygenase